MRSPSTEHAAAADPTVCAACKGAASIHEFPPGLGRCVFRREDGTWGLPGQVSYASPNHLDVEAALRCPNGCDLRTYGTHADDCPLEPHDDPRQILGPPPSDLQDVTRLPRHVLPGDGLTGEQFAKLWDDTTPANERGGPGVSWVPGHEGRTDPDTGLFQGVSLSGPVRKRNDHTERHPTPTGAADAPLQQHPAAVSGGVSSVPTAALQELVVKAAGMAEWIAHEVGGPAAWEDYQEVREIAARLGVKLEEKP